ncbi:TPA: VRR-NUC domain-containing protein [Campylobacter jejuni]|nr:VRR-NUC domain-containing protein [Campylobacter jejuni]
MTESAIQRQIIDYLNSKNIYNFKIIACNKKGTPDIFCLINGLALFLEVKTKKGKVSKLQNYQIDRINELGGKAKIVRSVDDVKNIIMSL